jgi:hypothetical protein
VDCRASDLCRAGGGRLPRLRKAVHYPFINFDDQEYVFGRPEITSGVTLPGIGWALTHVHGGNWHPLTSISHMVDCQLYGLKAGGHHFTNICLHALAALLLFGALREMTGAFWRAAFVAALFAIHPLRVESVVWIAERKDVLSGLFFALTLLAYAWYVRRWSIARYWVVLVAFGLGLMSKPMLVTTPIVLLLLDYWPLGRLQRSEVRGQKSERQSTTPHPTLSPSQGERKQVRGFDRVVVRKLIVEKIPLLALSLASVVATLLAQKKALGSIEELPLPWRLENALVSYVTYMWQTFWPARLAVFYPHTDGRLPAWEIVLAAIFLISLTGLAWIMRRRRPYLITGWLWFVIMLWPVIGVVQVGQQGHADRYTYLPQIGLILALAWAGHDLVGSLRHRREVLAASATVALTASAWMTFRQVDYWRDSESLWRHALAVTSNNDVAHANLADLLLQSGRDDEAVAHCEEALRIRPRNPDAQNNLGLALWHRKQPIGAVSHYEKALQVNPHHLNAESNLAWILATYVDPSFRDGSRAVRLMMDVTDRAGDSNPMVLRTLGAAYAETGQFPQAIVTAERAVEIARRQGDNALMADLQMNLENYRQNLPLRDPGSAAVPRILARPQ